MGYITVYEQSFLGIGESTWVILFLFLLCMGLAMVIYVGYNKLGPCKGYLLTQIFGSGSDRDLAIVFQNHCVSFKRLRYFSGVFEAMGMTWIAKKNEHHLFGGCSAELIADYWGLTQDPQINVATMEFIKAWNSDEDPSTTTDPNCKWMPKKSKRNPITDFDSLYAAIEKCPPDSEVRIRAFSYIPMYDLQRYYPRNLMASDLTGYQEAMRKVSEEQRQAQSTSYLPIICLVVGILIGVGIMMIAK